MRIGIGNKGIEIPVNLLVVLAISIIVLLSAVVFFLRGFNPAGESIAAQQEFNSCATSYVRLGCDDLPSQHLCSNEQGDTLASRGADAGFRTDPAVREAAGCPDNSIGPDSSTAPTGFEDSGGPQ